MAIYDCFTFFNELRLLDLRLGMLHKHVDYFVLVEAVKTFTGTDKPLYFNENKLRYEQYLHKIIHVVIDPWEAEFFQRNAILRGLANALPEDWILISDVDEIPSPEAIRRLHELKGNSYGFRQRLFYFRLNFMNISGQADLVWTIAKRRSVLTAPNSARDERELHFYKYGGSLINGGWHYSYLGDQSNFFAKIKAFSHQEYNTPEFLNAVDLQKVLSDGRDVFGRPGHRWAVVPIGPDTTPQYVLENIEEYADLIIPEKYELPRPSFGAGIGRCITGIVRLLDLLSRSLTVLSREGVTVFARKAARKLWG
jgi:beta-1,4-mannosyl-glycoprotein beta-1,4-N-acetylglucosaminyltransferase